MKFDFFTEVSVAVTPKTTDQGIAGSVGVILGFSAGGSLGEYYGITMRDEAGSYGKVWMVAGVDLTPTGRTFKREDFYGSAPFTLRVPAERYADDDDDEFPEADD